MTADDLRTALDELLKWWRARAAQLQANEVPDDASSWEQADLIEHGIAIEWCADQLTAVLVAHPAKDQL